jgi:hypothetical protein
MLSICGRTFPNAECYIPLILSQHTRRFIYLMPSLRRVIKKLNVMVTAIRYCGSGSVIRDPVPFWPLDPGSGIG